jgi:hypothetical protein
MGVFAAAILGGTLFLTVFGRPLLDPSNIGWLMRHDSQTYYLAFEHFRREAWQWPPGVITGIGYPIGTSIGNTDAIPLVAMPLKIAAAWLPAPFQFLGAWLFACWILQAVFGALLARQVTPRRDLQALVGTLFVLSPPLLHRTGHAALCAHWTWLAALWLLFARDTWSLRARAVGWLVLSGVSAAIQPYLAMGVLGLGLCAAADDLWRAAKPAGRWRACGLAVGLIAVTTAVLWMTGIFTVGSGDLQREGLGYFSMNLLAPVMPMGYSQWLPDVPMATPGQGEGFLYFGAGWLALMIMAAAAIARGRMGADHVPVVPRLGLAWVGLAAFTLLAVSPVITAGPRVLADLSAWTPAAVSALRSSGRFGWLLMYLAFALAMRAVFLRLPRSAATMVLLVALALQLGDLRGAYAGVWSRERSAAWTEYRSPLSPVWDEVMPAYRHLVMAPPDMCAAVWPSPAGEHLPFSMLAARHGASINSGNAGRYDTGAILDYCAREERDLRAGTVDDDSLYVLSPAMRTVLSTAAGRAVACGRLDAYDVCVTTSSLARWPATAARTLVAGGARPGG